MGLAEVAFVLWDSELRELPAALPAPGLPLPCCRGRLGRALCLALGSPLRRAPLKLCSGQLCIQSNEILVGTAETELVNTAMMRKDMKPGAYAAVQ